MAHAKAPTKLTGTIRSYLPEKGFGFILGPDQRDYFFHRSALVDAFDVEVGAAVTFLPGEGPKGPRAEQVERLTP